MKQIKMPDLKSLADSINSLDPKDVGNWPLPARVALLALWFAALVFAGYWFDTREQETELQRYQNEEIELKRKFETEAAKAANLAIYEQQLAVMQQSFGAMLAQLPKEHEVPDLLEDISQTGLAAGLEFQLFKPEPERPKEFFAELPIKLKVTGSYHEFGGFVSGLAVLPRIVTLHDIKITRAAGKQSDNLILEAEARTYRYLEGGAK